MAKMYFDKDGNLDFLKGKKIAIIGFGNQGAAQAQNLRDSGLDVIASDLPGTRNYDNAVKLGFKPVSADEASKAADVIQLLIPDEVQGHVYREAIRSNLFENNVLMCSHGFNIHFGQIVPPNNVDVIMVAPKGPGHLVRSEFEKGGGVPNLIAIFQDHSGKAKDIALAYSKGIGGLRAAVIETTFAEETETDLFGEQAVLCGGVSALVKAGFETLVEAGYQPEIAYYECMHELKLIVDLFYQGGLSWMRHSVSNTAEYGDLTRGNRIVTAETKKEMKKILEEVRSGQFAREWILECQANMPVFRALEKREKTHLIEKVGRDLRRQMKWIDVKEVD
ncbi:MAG TPA: ketol-acid reductoisomerase [Planctomycetota bacterium]|nr:ketol-acid reductoisomerase [Planctomycetota bacterium]